MKTVHKTPHSLDAHSAALIRHEPFHQRPVPAPSPDEGAACSECGAVYHAGHWRWPHQEPKVATDVCPACIRVLHHDPAGIIHLEGTYSQDHVDDLIRLIRSVAMESATQDPTNRLMGINGSDGVLIVKVTDTQLVHEIGQALSQAYGGKLAYEYPTNGELLRLRWRR